MEKSKAAVFLEAFIGLDPKSGKTWSGTMPFLLSSMRKAERLDCTYSLRIPSARRALLMSLNFHLEREEWRRNYYFSAGYREAVNREARKTHYEGEFAIQTGALFSLPRAFPEKKCLSLHDGNFAERVSSGFASNVFAPAKIDEILEFEKETAREMTAVCTLSEYVRQSFIKNYGVNSQKVFNIGGAVNFCRVPAENLNKNYESKKMLFVGSEFDRKGGRNLLAAFEILRGWIPDAELHIVGPRNIGEIPPQVVFHGHLSKQIPEEKEQLERLFSESCLFVLPSLYEPYGIAPLEAMSYGMPCVVTNAWALSEMVSDGITGALVEKGSIEDLASKMHHLLSDPDRLRALGRNGRKKVVENHMWSTVVDRLGLVLDHL